jgi:hypothetical protein
MLRQFGAKTPKVFFGCGEQVFVFIYKKISTNYYLAS